MNTQKNPSFNFWQPVLTDHMSYTVNSLGVLTKKTINAFSRELINVERHSPVWSRNKFKYIDLKVINSFNGLKIVAQQLQKKDSVNFFCSPFDSFFSITLLVLFCLFKRNIYLISEPYLNKPYGYNSDKQRYINFIKFKIRPLLYKVYCSIIKNKIKGVFTISDLSYSQYLVAGLPAHQLFKFGYFVPIASKKLTYNPAANKMSLVYIGSLMERKGLDLLLKVMEQLNKSSINVSLDIYGPGEISKYIISSNCVYKGSIPFGTSHVTLANYDALVVTSKFDGWGVIVNESINCGVPVICSNCAGAKTLIHKFSTGIVFESTSINSLYSSIIHLVKNPRERMAMHKSCLKSALEIQPINAAKYILNIVSSASSRKIKAPWYV